MEMYLEGEEPSVDELRAAIRRATIAGRLNPVLCGSAFKNKGVQPMLDAVVDYLPSPLDVGAIQGHALGDEDAVIERDARRERALLGAGLQDHERQAPRQAHLHPGLLGQARRPGPRCSTRTKDNKERIGKIYQMHANHREERDGVGAGQIVAVQGLKNTTTGDTLCDPTPR